VGFLKGKRGMDSILAYRLVAVNRHTQTWYNLYNLFSLYHHPHCCASFFPQIHRDATLA